jgi:hypothetical protein
MCKLSFIHLVNENSSILSLLLFFSHIFFANCVCHLLARYFLCEFKNLMYQVNYRYKGFLFYVFLGLHLGWFCTCLRYVIVSFGIFLEARHGYLVYGLLYGICLRNIMSNLPHV